MKQWILTHAGIKVSTYDLTTRLDLGFEVISEFEARSCAEIQHNGTWYDTGLDRPKEDIVIIQLIKPIEPLSKPVASIH